MEAQARIACSDLTCDGETIETIYQKRWKVETFHKTLKGRPIQVPNKARDNPIIVLWLFMFSRSTGNHFALQDSISRPFVYAFRGQLANGLRNA